MSLEGNERKSDDIDEGAKLGRSDGRSEEMEEDDGADVGIFHKILDHREIIS
jgi:hypothetical protein